ncbi:hypothetical protein [Laceyella tengchongensis]|jgi:hypothetical protein|uniref:hypothetical protein n=1 Tax=Laceyella tengchongensis TaxID=574699 RepID=UPI0012B8D86C|nr:hypothetical protein [Laceyella tengchongensis]
MNKHVRILLVIGILGLFGFGFSHINLFSWVIGGGGSPTETKPEATEKDAIKSREVAESFVRHYVPYDADNPLAYIDKIQPYVTNDFYKRFAKTGSLTGSEITKKELKALKVFPVDGGNVTEMEWNVVTVQELTLKSGTTMDDEEWFWVTVVKDSDGKWRVSELQVSSDG